MDADGYLAKEDAKRYLTLTAPGEEPQTWVPLDLFQAVQEERDELRRVLGLIGAWRASGMESINDLDRLLLRGGFDLAACRAVLDVIRWAAAESPTA